jgi:hypothetical protein
MTNEDRASLRSLVIRTLIGHWGLVIGHSTHPFSLFMTITSRSAVSG